MSSLSAIVPHQELSGKWSAVAFFTLYGNKRAVLYHRGHPFKRLSSSDIDPKEKHAILTTADRAGKARMSG
jgi:hypothetical protein